jgi:hypothetical protein
MNVDLEEKVASTGQIIETSASIIFSILFIYSIMCFYRFMRKANKGMLFSETSSQLWKQISTVFIIIGVLAGLLSIVDFKFIGLVPVCAFTSSIAFSFSKIFKDSSILKFENDLTI